MFTKQEFNTLTGREWPDEDFGKALRIYAQLGVFDKEAFIDEFLKSPGLFTDGAIVTRLTSRAELLEAQVAQQQALIDTMKTELLKAALSDDTDKTWARVADVLGAAEVIRYKLDNELDLSTDDRAYIINNLK